ncbi:UNVERIFIED_CONTAM: hypothetical protein HDU68_004454 [Siphonaria sp. JEL0065]|nr:hypothetical protein HDU68_004454 [Siphonaria sp. JEL0065]
MPTQRIDTPASQRKESLYFLRCADNYMDTGPSGTSIATASNPALLFQPSRESIVVADALQVASSTPIGSILSNNVLRARARVNYISVEKFMATLPQEDWEDMVIPLVRFKYGEKNRLKKFSDEHVLDPNVYPPELQTFVSNQLLPWKFPPRPITYETPMERMWYLKKIYFNHPEYTLPWFFAKDGKGIQKHPLCPYCRNDNSVRYKDTVRRTVMGETETFRLIGVRYVCPHGSLKDSAPFPLLKMKKTTTKLLGKVHPKSFRSFDESTLRLIPDFAAPAFPFRMSKRAGITRTIATGVVHDLVSGKSIEASRDRLLELHTSEYHRRELNFYSHCKFYDQKHPNATISKPVFRQFNDAAGYVGHILSSDYLSDTFFRYFKDLVFSHNCLP